MGGVRALLLELEASIADFDGRGLIVYLSLLLGC